MMKSVRFLLINLLAWGGFSFAHACGPEWYTPGGYHMYRVYETTMQDANKGWDCYPSVSENCTEWQWITSMDIPLDDIYQVVYKMSLEEFETIYDNRKATYENKFAEWITKRDAEALDFLLLAKTNEYIRLKRNSRWYYPSMKIGARMTLEEVADKALTTQSKRFHDRYLLQGVRALFTLGRYQECIELWKNEASGLPEGNVMRQLIFPYIAGAEVHIGNTRKAIEYFAQIGDINSMLYCMGREGEEIGEVDALAFVCEHAPNSPYIRKTLQEYVRRMEPDGEYWCMHEEVVVVDEDFKKLHSLCLQMARDKRTSTPAMWYYTAAFLSDMKGDVREASNLLSKAEQLGADIYLQESIKVLRMYIDSKLYPYDAFYEKRLFAQLQWLDEKIVNNITDEVRNATSNGYQLSICISYYYWNDMLRRILLDEVCPRMIEAGKTTRALQLANMASNRLLGIIDKHTCRGYKEKDDGYEYFEVELSMDEYRYSKEFYNRFDYSNPFFEMIDSLGLDAAIRYVENVNAPRSEFDKYLHARGYTNKDYLYDILGTQCLRNMRYREAVEYLGAVSTRYYYHHNVDMKYDPFVADFMPIHVDDDFKYKFAREMYSLEQNISMMKDLNRKALMMARFAIGIKNSFEHCWGLTQYYVGTVFYNQSCNKRDWEKDQYTTAAMNRFQNLLDQAICMAADDDTAAEIQYWLCNFKTVAKKYPNTIKGQLVRGECDLLYDHHAEKRKTINYSHRFE